MVGEGEQWRRGGGLGGAQEGGGVVGGSVRDIEEGGGGADASSDDVHLGGVFRLDVEVWVDKGRVQVVEEVGDVLGVLVLEVVKVDLSRVDFKEQGHERGLAVAPGLVAVVHQRRVVQRRGVLRRPVVQI